MSDNNGKLAGILGTVILHLIAAIIFMSFQISSLQKFRTEKFELEIAPPELPVTKEKIVELPGSRDEKVLQNEEKMVNIARNLANTDKGDQKINASDYIENVKNELIRSGKLGADNFIDEQKKKDLNNSDEKINSHDNEVNSDRQKEKEQPAKPGNYKGPTRIYYDLMGRSHTYLPLPIYMCEGSGKVVLSIEVNQKGEVEKAAIISGESTAANPCLIETAIATAIISHFNPDLNAPRIQEGTLTYLFVAQ